MPAPSFNTQVAWAAIGATSIAWLTDFTSESVCASIVMPCSATCASGSEQQRGIGWRCGLQSARSHTDRRRDVRARPRGRRQRRSVRAGLAAWPAGGDAVRRTWPIYLALFDVTAQAYGRDPIDPYAVATACLDATRDWSPALLRELEGVAEGAGLDLIDVMVLNARTEILSCAAGPASGLDSRPRLAASAFSPSAVTECSAVVELEGPDGTALACQTWDWHDELSDGWHTQEVRGDRHAFVGLCEFGMLAKIGMNDAGLGTHFNLLRHASESGEPAAVVPVHLLARTVLGTASTLDEAQEIVESAPVGASTVLTTVTEHGARCIEISPAGIGIVEPTDGWLVHTNHFLAPELAVGEAVDMDVSTTIERCDLLRGRAAAADGPLEHADLARVLDAHDDDGAAVCRHVDETMPFGYRTATLATVLLDPGNREANVRTLGPRDGGTVVALRAGATGYAD